MRQSARWFDFILVFLLGGFLLLHYLHFFDPYDDTALFIFALLGTLPVIFSAGVALKRREISIDLLAGIALITALIVREWPSAVFINLMLASARIFGRYTEGQARRAIQSLLKLRPHKVRVKRGVEVIEIPLGQVKVGDLVIIDAGERVPVDGTIEVGTADIDQSSLTGESIPVSKQKGDQALSSTLIVSGSLQIRAKKIGKDTTLAKIIQLVEFSQQSKAGIHTTAEKFTIWYIGITLVGSLLAYYFTSDLNFVLALLLVACADDIAVAVPLAFLAAIGAAAHHGIIIKGGDFLEGLTKVKTLLMDKTGTLTSGILTVQSIVPFDGVSQGELLKYAAAVEYFSDHPAAKAIVKYAENESVEYPKPEDINEIPGKGSTARWNGKEIVSGKLIFMREKNIPISDSQQQEIESAKDRGFNTTLIAYDNKLIGFLGLADQLRPNMAESIKELREIGISRLVMLTGDNEKVAKKIAGEAGITEYHANLMPEDKLKYIRAELNNKSKDGMVGMVGDGVNDAAALALADVGIAMGVIGSDASIEAADVALMRDDLSKIPAVIRLGRYTMKITYQDFWIWGVVNAIGFGLVIMHVIGPQGAAAYNFITDFLPFINSLRLFRLHRKFI